MSLDIHTVDDRAHALRWLAAEERDEQRRFDQRMASIKRRRELLSSMTFDEDGWRTGSL